MALDQYFEDPATRNDNGEEDKASTLLQKSDLDKVSAIDDRYSSGTSSFDCNICLDSVQEPVVTLCGHLYCWSCIFKWLSLQNVSPDDDQQTRKQCPVCKAEVSHSTLVPLYGRGLSSRSNNSESIPKRPPARSPANLHQTQTYYPQQDRYTSSPMLSRGLMTYSNVLDPVIEVFGETVCARLFGTSTVTNRTSRDLAGRRNARERRRTMQADKSLSRICFFLACCVLLCLILF